MPELLQCGRGKQGTESTDANPQQAQFHAPTQRREERECVSHDCRAVCMCACRGLEQGHAHRDVTAKRLAPTLPIPP
jgi:hypothetical protein